MAWNDPPAETVPAKAAPVAPGMTNAERYRRAQVLGLVLIAGAILAATLLRADLHTLFAPGWWRF